ncbi:alpha/beta-Hydrolases superfamily protein [Euphorbia peplus]|nr:alpha/beta-Hydrolases superfamily protein [Euphorbia peplus]
MPTIIVKLHSSIFKYHQKNLLQTLSKTPKSNPFGITSRPQDSTVAGNPKFTDGVATKDIHLDNFSSLTVRIFLPETAVLGTSVEPQLGAYGGYSPPPGKFHRRLPVMLQFHGGGFVSGSNETVGNDAFCRRIAKMCDVVVVAVGYRLAPESKFPAAFEDGIRVLNWVAKQVNLGECRRFGVRKRRIFDSFGASMVEPWLAAHADPSRCILLGASSGANIADYVARKALEAPHLFDPVNIVAQVLMYPFFIGTIPPMHSEIKLANSYVYDKTMCKLAWKLFLPENEFDLDHPAANPLLRLPPPKHMIPTLIVVAENDFMRDRAIAYSEDLRKVNVDAPLLEYKDTVHEFATLDALVQTQQAKVCAEDISIWVKKYISIRGHEFSY